MILSLISTHGSPGVTTGAMALAAVGAEQRAASDARQAVDFLELDPAGGDVEPYTGSHDVSGLLRAASDLSPAAIAECVVEAPPGVLSILAPTSALEATSTVLAAVDRWGAAVSASGGVVVTDAGRWEKAHPASRRLVGSDLVAVLCRPDARGVEHVRHVIDDVRQLVWPAPVVVVTVGSQPYGPDEISLALGIPVAGSLAWDPKGAAALWREGIGSHRFRRWPTCWLARSARALLADMAQLAQQVPAQ